MTDISFFSPNGTRWNLQGPGVRLDTDNMITKRVREYTHCGVIYTIFVCVHVAAPRGIFYKLEVKIPLGVRFLTNPDHDFRVVKGLLTHLPITMAQYRAAEDKVLMRLADRHREEYFEQMRANASVNKPVHVFGQLLDGHYGNSSIQARITPTGLHNITQFAGLFMENLQHIKKLVQSVEGFLWIDITLPVVIPHLAMSTNVTCRLAGKENKDRIQTRGWLELQNGKNIDNVLGDISDTRTEKAIRMVDGTSTMVSTLKEHVQEDVDVYTDVIEKMIFDNYDDAAEDGIDEYDVHDECFGGIMGVFCRSSLHGDYSGGVTHGECRAVG